MPALSFISRSVWEATDVEERAALTRYVSSVNDALALRTQSGCAIERLAMSYTTHSPHPDDPYQDGMPPASVDAFHNRVGGIRDPDGERYLERLMSASVDAKQGVKYTGGPLTGRPVPVQSTNLQTWKMGP